MARGQPHVVSIAPGFDMPRLVAEALRDGGLLALPFADQPLLLADLVIYVPNQRAKGLLEAAIIAAFGPGPVILPKIRPLGEAEDGLEMAETPFLATTRAISALERRFLLRPDILNWQASLGLTPGLAQSLALGDALGRLIDEMAIENVPLARLASVTPKDYDPARFDEYWNLTRDFLRLAAEHWPEKLARLQAEDETALRIAALKREAERLTTAPPQTPMLVIGSTGSVKASAGLMRAIARLEYGAVVLPGLDLTLDDAAFAKIGAEDAPLATRFAHPQAMLKRALSEIGIAREDVTLLGEASPALAARNRFISEALRPAETTAGWHEAQKHFPLREALAGITLVEARDEREEALAIAVLMRETLENPKARVALVTPDRALAARVKAELLRWQITVEDSAGTPLGESAAGVFLRLMLEAAQTRSSIALMALLRHPLFRLGFSAEDAGALADALELLVLRGRHFSAASSLEARVLAAFAREDHHLPGPAARISEARRAALPGFAKALDAALTPFGPDAPEAPLDALMPDLLTSLTMLAQDEAGESLFADDAIDTLLMEIARFGAGVMAGPASLAALLTPLLQERVVPQMATGHPRAMILGVIEARLLHADRLIIGGLNEGSFPPQAQGDALLNRAMRVGLGLQPPERRIGQSAHDLMMLAGHADLTLTRAARSGGQPGIPSRFLRRMAGFAGVDAWKTLIQRGEAVLALARRLDAHGPYSPIAAPDIRPAMPRAPAALSITEIETLRRDPYAIYAKRILTLDPLDALDAPLDARDRGTALHRALELYAKAPPVDEAEAMQRLRDLGLEAFRPFSGEPELFSFWWQDFEAIIPGFIAFDAARRTLGTALFLETRARTGFALETGEIVRLSGKADRIEDGPDGIILFDYKTGGFASAKQVLSGKSPQLTISAALVEAGAFSELPAGEGSCHRLSPGGRARAGAACLYRAEG